MTPDTAALRALADAATPGPWTYIGKGDFDTPPIDVDEADWGPEGHHGYRLRTWSDGTGWRNADAAFIAALDPDTVRALCDAADEVERLREDVEALTGLLSAGAIGTAPGSDSHRMVLAQRNHYKRQRDASRTAHAALVADLRSWVEFEDHHLAPCRTYRPYRTSEGPPPCDCDLRHLRALIDRHAPTTGATP